ncbi:MAG: DUF3310 domain-containing protein [Coprococcus catus]|nr:DUF3310 domain-containing protein [Coprococcus catus]
MIELDIGKKILRIMKEKEMSQKQLAKASGVTEAAISKYISGEREPRITFLKRIADALDVPADEFLYEKVDHPEHYQGKNECIDVMIAMFGAEAVKSFCRCNAYKYRFRADKKNGEEDIRKAEWYESKLIELEGEKCVGCKVD